MTAKLRLPDEEGKDQPKRRPIPDHIDAAEQRRDEDRRRKDRFRGGRGRGLSKFVPVQMP